MASVSWMPLAAAGLMLGRKVARLAPDRSDVNGRKPAQAGFRLPGNSCLDSAEQTAQQRDQGGANQGDTATGHELIDPQIGGSHSSMAGGGVSEMIQF